MNYLQDLTSGACGVDHLPNEDTNRVWVYNAGAVKLDVCPINPKFDHVRFPPRWLAHHTITDGGDVLTIRRGDNVIARIVQAEGDDPTAYTIVTPL